MDIQKLLDDYMKWLKTEITFDKIGEYYEITTPYLNNANDYLQIYVKQENEEIFFTDDGEIIHNMKMNGIQLNQNRKNHLQKILNQFGVKLEGDELVAKAQLNNFAQKKHFFIQAMLRVDDMFSMVKTRETSFFIDDVQSFFEKKDIYYSENVQFMGVSGFSHNYDFLLQRSKTKPERLCRAINTPNKSSMENILFAWNDTKPARNNNSQLIVIMNDNKKVANGIVEAFQNYDVNVIFWSEREKEKNISLLSVS